VLVELFGVRVAARLGTSPAGQTSEQVELSLAALGIDPVGWLCIADLAMGAVRT
jgi:hypothetical protein